MKLILLIKAGNTTHGMERLQQCFPTFFGMQYPAEGKYNLRHPMASS